MRCKTCLLDLAPSAFYASNQAQCKECIKASVKQNRREKIEYYRSYDRMRSNLPHRVHARLTYSITDAARISQAVAKKKWAVANALRKKATTTVQNAIRDKRLERQPCFICGAKAQAHHPDYNAPLAVSWLCCTHHAQTHREHREWLRAA
jgi:hypothetical protein